MIGTMLHNISSYALFKSFCKGVNFRILCEINMHKMSLSIPGT